MEIKYDSKDKKCPFDMYTGDNKNIFIASVECQECIYFSLFYEVKELDGIFNCSYNVQKGS